MRIVMDAICQALARSQNPDRIIAFASAVIAWLVVTVLRAVIG